MHSWAKIWQITCKLTSYLVKIQIQPCVFLFGEMFQITINGQYWYPTAYSYKAFFLNELSNQIIVVIADRVLLDSLAKM